MPVSSPLSFYKHTDPCRTSVKMLYLEKHSLCTIIQVLSVSQFSICLIIALLTSYDYFLTEHALQCEALIYHAFVISIAQEQHSWLTFIKPSKVPLQRCQRVKHHYHFALYQLPPIPAFWWFSLGLRSNYTYIGPFWLFYAQKMHTQHFFPSALKFPVFLRFVQYNIGSES